MRKPSIFSKDYEKLMRKRRKNIRIFILCGIFMFISVIIVWKVDFKIIAENIKSLVSNNEYINDEAIEGVEDIDTEEVETENDVEDVSNKYTYFDVLVGNCQVTILYEEVDGEDLIEEVMVNSDIIQVDVSPDKRKVLLIDDKQNMYVINNNKEVLDITYKEYVSTKGTVFEKDDILNKYENYIWHSEGKFIDNDKIAYITNVPYFGEDLNQYITVVDVNDNSHKTQWQLKGKEIKIENLQEKGLELNIDGNVIYITANYDVVK